MTKIDIDELERKARTAMQGSWSVSSTDPTKYCTVLDDDGSGDIYEVCGDVTIRNAEHIVAASPQVVLALIRRIRELEGALGDTAHRAGRIDLCDSIDMSAIAALLEKGAVLP